MYGGCREFSPGVGPTTVQAYICCVKIGTCKAAIVSGSARYYEGGCLPQFGAGIIQTPPMLFYASGRYQPPNASNTSTSKDYPTQTQGCVKQGECAVPYLEQVRHWTASGGTMEMATPSDETMDRLLHGAVEAYPDACRAADLYPRTAVAATHHATSSITVVVRISPLPLPP